MNDLLLTTDDGVTLTAHHHPAAGRGRAAVVLVHGFTASKDHPEVVAVAEALAAAGHHVISYDARGHHRSGGLCTLGDAEWLDVQAAIGAARGIHDRIITVGASMGGIAVLRHGVTDPEVAGVVTVSAPAEWRLPKNARALLAMLLTRTRLGRRFAARKLGVRIHPTWSDPAPPVTLAERLRVPLAVIHGDADQMIPQVAATRLAARATGASRIEIVRGMRHAFDPRSIPAILGAVDWMLSLGNPHPAHA
jgi:pimeloyl-ACP methyl ester carboxylesterase